MADEIGIWSPYLDPARSDTQAITASSVKVADTRALQSPRKLIVIRNISPNAVDIISLSFGVPAVANTGVVLRQYDIYVEAVDKGFSPYQGTINAICATAAGVLAILER
jgi:hypothetical protein